MTQPIYQMATLRDVFRPTQAGIQIHFGQYLCTMGFNVDHGSERSFITNSHCTGVSGDAALVPMDHYQPLQDSNGDRMVDAENFIGSQVDDPSTTITLDCVSVLDDPVVRAPGPCRWSDASRAPG